MTKHTIENSWCRREDSNYYWVDITDENNNLKYITYLRDSLVLSSRHWFSENPDKMKIFKNAKIASKDVGLEWEISRIVYEP